MVHTLRALSLHALVLLAGIKLASLGWDEFYHWGHGPVGRVVLSEDSRLILDGASGSSKQPGRGGAGFALFLLYDLGMTGSEVCLSSLRYMGYLVELYRGPHAVSRADVDGCAVECF